MIRKAFEGMHPWVQVIFFGSMMVTGIAVAAFLGMAAMAAGHGWSLDHAMTVAGQPRTSEGFWMNIAVNSANQLIAFGGAALAFGWLFRRRRLDGMGLRGSRGRMWAWLFLAGLATVAALPLLDLSQRLNAWLIEFLPSGLKDQADYFERLAADTTEALLISTEPGASAALLLAIAVLPGLCEELAFRSVFQPLFVRSTRRLHLGIWLGAAVFSAIHMQFHGFLPRMIIGAGLGYVVVWSGSIWPAVFAHFVNNGHTVIQARRQGIEWVQQELNTSGPWESGDYVFAAVCAVFFVAAIGFMRRLAPWTEQAQRYAGAIAQD